MAFVYLFICLCTYLYQVNLLAHLLEDSSSYKQSIFGLSLEIIMDLKGSFQENGEHAVFLWGGLFMSPRNQIPLFLIDVIIFIVPMQKELRDEEKKFLVTPVSFLKEAFLSHMCALLLSQNCPAYQHHPDGKLKTLV